MPGRLGYSLDLESHYRVGQMALSSLTQVDQRGPKLSEEGAASLDNLVGVDDECLWECEAGVPLTSDNRSRQCDLRSNRVHAAVSRTPRPRGEHSRRCVGGNRRPATY